MPPLRERREDIPLLVRHFLDEAFPEEGGAAAFQLDEETRRRLEHYGWPGNVRELRNFILRSAVLAEGGVLSGTASDAPLAPPPATGRGAATAGEPLPRPLAEAPAHFEAEGIFARPYKEARAAFVVPFERAYLRAQLERAGGNLTRAAREAGLDRSYLGERARKLGLR